MQISQTEILLMDKKVFIKLPDLSKKSMLTINKKKNLFTYKNKIFLKQKKLILFLL